MLRAYSNAFFVSSVSYVKRAKAVSSPPHIQSTRMGAARNRYSPFWYLGINLFVPARFVFFLHFLESLCAIKTTTKNIVNNEKSWYWNQQLLNARW